MNQGGVESTGQSTCYATWPLCNKSFGKQVFFSQWDLSSLFSCETWQMGHSEFDRPLLCSSADNYFTQMSVETLTGARRGSELLTPIQRRESLLPRISACPHPIAPAAQRSCKAAQRQGEALARGRDWPSTWSWLQVFFVRSSLRKTNLWISLIILL